MPSTLKRADYEDCLVAFLLGRGKICLSNCVHHAYADLQRTLDGVGKFKNLKSEAASELSERFGQIRSASNPTQCYFDDWHRATCLSLKNLYARQDYNSFSFGHAQKWLNMTFKYIYVTGSKRIFGFEHLYDLCHVPLDKTVLEGLAGHGFSELPCGWSKLDDYDCYFDRQQWIRRRFNLAPLDVEFYLWLGKPLPANALAGE